MSRPKPPLPPLPLMPSPITWGRYVATPAPPLDIGGRVRWRLVGPGVDRWFTWRDRAAALRDVGEWMRTTGLDVPAAAFAVAWVEFPAPSLVCSPGLVERAPPRQRVKPAHEGPMPAWAVVNENKEPFSCIIVGCRARMNSRRLCRTHNTMARRAGVRHRIGPPSSGKPS